MKSLVNNGVFDEDFGRLQIHFETVERDTTNPTRYHVTGASRHLKQVTPFNGNIDITDVKRLNGTLEDMLKRMPGGNGEDGRITEGLESGPYVLVNGVFNLREDSTKKFSGVFNGNLTFALREEPDGRLSNKWNRTTSKYYRNFIYQGKWTSHDGSFSADATWADGRIPVPDGVDVGQNEFTVAPKYAKEGWKKDGNGNYIDNPEYWWRVK